MTAKQRRLIISRALALLEQGVLADSLSALLVGEFGLTRSQARALTAAALRQRKARNGKNE
jgi:hypothetical protein